MSTRSVAKADVAELSAALDSAVDQEKEHHLVIVSTNKVLSTTQFKQMFYSRGDDFFQIANVYECPDSCDSVHSSVWGIDCSNAHDVTGPGFPGLVEMSTVGAIQPNPDRLANADVTTAGGYSIAKQQCYNFNKLGGRENDPPGCAWAYSYVHDQARNFYAQHEVMGYLEKDTCVKRDFWTACSRMSIEDQLYGLAFASETDQDLCMKVTCARRWSEVEDALAESCTAADTPIVAVKHSHEWSAVTLNMQPDGNGAPTDKVLAESTFIIKNHQGAVILTYTSTSAAQTVEQWEQAVEAVTAPDLAEGYDIGVVVTNATAGVINVEVQLDANTAASLGGPLTMSGTIVATSPTPTVTVLPQATSGKRGGFVDLYINVRVTNGHPKALDTILRVRFTVAYTFHAPSALWTWNTRASTAASGVINTGVVGDAPEGGKQQHEDTTVVA